MHSPTEVQNAPTVSTQCETKSVQRAERAYQGLTIAAMLVLLSTLWLFR
jgi:hypothetical protein